MVGSPQGSSVHRIPQARTLEWLAIFFSGGSSWPRDGTRISCIGRWILYHWATRKAPCSPKRSSNKLQNIKWLFPLIWLWNLEFGSVQSLSWVWLVTPWTAAEQASLSITNSQSLLKHTSTESVMPPNHLILCRPPLLPPSIFPSIRVFSNESALCIRWPKYWSFNFNISTSNEYSGLISFRMHCLDLLAVQGPVKSLLQHHSSKASVL